MNELSKEPQGNEANTLLPAVLFENREIKCVEHERFYQLFSDGHFVNFERFYKFKFGKTGLLWCYWNTLDMGTKFYRDCIVGRFLKVEKPEFEVISRNELLIWKNSR